MTTRTTRSDRTDAVTVLVLGAGAAVLVLGWMIRRFGAAFGSSAGIAWRIDIDDMPVNAAVSSGKGAVDAVATEATVHAAHVNALSTSLIAASIVVSTLMMLTVIGAIMFLARNASRGVMFTKGTVRAWDAAAGALLIGTAVTLFCDTLGGNGVLAAVGIADLDVSPTRGFARYAVVMAIGIACALIGIAFRRGLQLQRDTEGLV